MMNIWNSFPFIRILSAFLAGILLAINTESFNHIHWLFIIIVLTSSILIHQYTHPNFQFKYLRGVPLLLFFLFAGIKLVELHQEINYPNHFSKSEGNTYLLKLDEPIKSKSNTIKVTVEVIAVKGIKNIWQKTTGKLLLYLQKDYKAQQLKYGDILITKCKLIDCPSPQNPYEFNYKKYLSFHQIHQQSYLKSEDWFYTGGNDSNYLFALSYRIRNYLLKIISNAQITGDEYAIGSALILGYEDHLSTEVIGAFAATGALHVLSVSGLHVGIVFLVINFFLKFLGDSKQALVAIFIISISGLWLYALITGMSPSVWRAAAMFSLISLGKFYRKDINTINIIACSAFILLCINPFMITEVGFQLSYLAVIGIVSIYPLIYELFEVKNKWLEKIWAISCISVAAQLVTFPLGLLYFHQFPNYFIVSNLVIIPLSTLILYAGIALLAFAKIPMVGILAAKTLQYLLWLLKESVNLFENLPFAIIDGIAISTFDTFLIYGVLISLLIYWQGRQIHFLKIALGICLLFTSLQIIEKIEQRKQEKIVVYAINKHTAVDFISGNKSTLIADKPLLLDKDKIRFHLTPNRVNHGIKKSNDIALDELSGSFENEHLKKVGIYLIFKDLVIAYTASHPVNYTEFKLVPSIVFLNKLNIKKINTIFELFPKATFICDGSISANLYEKIRLKNSGLNIRSVLKEGAITIEI